MSELLFIIAVIFFIIVLVVFSNLQSRITALQLQIQALKKRLDELVLSQRTSPTLEQVNKPIIAAQLTDAKTSALPEPTLIAEPVNTIEQHKPLTTAPPPNQYHKIKKSPDEKSLSYRFIQWLVTGNPVAKVAIIILFFGLSYLLKYSIDHELLSPEIRILSSLVLGLILLTLGWRLRHKKELYALILQGGAIGSVYFTLFAAFKLYAIIPLLLVFVLLIVVCATSIMFAVLQRAISLAVIACVGGYLAPILLSTGDGNHIALFSYYLLISSAILIVSFWQSWRVLNLIGFLFTFVVAMLWGYDDFRAEFYTECQLFILANMLIYGVLAVLLSVRNSKSEPYQNLFDIVLLFSVPLAAFSLQYAITEHWKYAPALSALGFGLFYLLGSFAVLHIWHGRAKQLALYGLCIGLGFSTLAVPLALTANWTALIWLIEGTLISCAALAQKQYRFSWVGIIIVLFGIISAIVSGAGYINNAAFITLYGVMSFIILFNACLWHHYRALHTSADSIKLLFVVIAIMAWSFWIIGSIDRLSASSASITQPIIACYVLAVWLWFFIGRKTHWQVLSYAVIALWPVLLLALVNNILFYTYTYYTGLWGLSWLAAFVSSYIYLYVDNKNLTAQNKNLPLILHISLLWIILAWLYSELNWLLSFLPWGFATVKWSILTLASGLIILGFFLLNKYQRFPMQRYSAQYWQIGMLPLGLYLLFQVITGLYSNGQIIYWTYIPLINLLEESAAFAIMALAVWFSCCIKLQSPQQKLATVTLQLPLFTRLLIITLIFLWGNSVILRSLSQWLDISWSFYPLWHNNIVQVTLSLVWTLIAVILVATANCYLLRNVWFTGAILQAVVVVKLALVDSVELDGLMRAFVFIGVALLMLVIGYLAPLPPKMTAINSADRISKNS